MTRIAVIDGNSLMHRAFHAVPSYMMTSDGRHTNAVFGFVSMLIKLVNDFEPDGVICAFDAGIPEFRIKAIQRYKAQRPPTDPDLKEQFPMIEELLGVMGIPVVKLAGYEGDDILGTLAAKGDEEGIETYLVTGDRDAFQLASEHTRIVATRVGLSDVKVYGPNEVRERYGIGPELVPDFIALKGDSSDNIPGVPGVGEKTAAKLLAQYGSVEAIIENASELKGKIAKNVAENVDAIEAGKIVATIVRDLDIDIDPAKARFPNFDPNEVVAAFKALEISSHISKVLALQTSTTDGLAVDTQEELLILEGDEALLAIKEMSSKASPISVLQIAGNGSEQETLQLALDDDDGPESKVILAVCDSERVALVKESNDLILDLLYELAMGPCKVVSADLKALLHTLYPADSSRESRLEISEINPDKFFDVSIAAYLLDSSSNDYGVERLASDYLGQHLPVPEKPLRGKPARQLSDAEIATRAKAIWDLAPRLISKLEAEGSMNCFRNIEMPLILVLAAMERAGLEIYPRRIHELSDQISDELNEVSSKVFALVGEEFNLSSPKQLSHILFEKLGLPVKKKTHSGYSTDASVLSSLSSLHPVPGLVLEYRELSKIKNTYLDTLPDMVAGDGRIHTTFNQTIAATGRLSSSDPNLQNIPVRTELGRKIRTAFGPYREMANRPDGAVFLSADYSQIELRLLAHLSGDEGLITAFLHGDDFHRSTAARIFGIDEADVTPDLRSRAKAVNFGIVYGQQAFGLSQSLSIPVYEAREMIDRYFDAYPGVRAYLDGLVEYVEEHGWVETFMGRRRYVPEIRSKNPPRRSAAERVAMNHPMQGSAADIIKMAMVSVQRRLLAEKLDSVMMLQIHDELDFSCPKSEIDRLSEIVVAEMSGVAELKVPLVVQVSCGDTWADAK